MANIILENKAFRLVIGENSVPVSLYNKETGEECLAEGFSLPLFAATQERPFNNEIKLAYLNKRTTFNSNSCKLEGSRLTVGFEVFPFEAFVDIDIQDTYMGFTLAGFDATRVPYPWPMDIPPVTEFTLIQLAVPAKCDFGKWLNVAHTEKSSLSIMAAEPAARTDDEVFGDVRLMRSFASKEIKLEGTKAILALAATERFLDTVEKIEEDHGLPNGVKSRRSDNITAPIYWVANLNPETVDDHIRLAKLGGFKYILMYYKCMFQYEQFGYAYCGEYDIYNQHYPNGAEDMKLVLKKIKDAGLGAGIHFLHTHIGIKTKYVTPVADRRLNLKKRFTLSKLLAKDDTEIFVDENPYGMPLSFPECRVLRFDGEVISYEGFTTEPPYRFTGCGRGHYGTYVTEHAAYTVGGVLDVSEYSATSIYLNQDSDFQEEIASKLADFYNLGFDFIYYDGSEGTNLPYDYHVSNAQYRVYTKMAKEPAFCEGAAKSHFGWHMLSGANAFDIFPSDVFKPMIIEHPYKEAIEMKKDFTRVDFGWWAFDETTRADLYEFGIAKAVSLDCPITINGTKLITEAKSHPRVSDIFTVLSRWEDARERKLITKEDKARLFAPDKEFTLLKNADGGYEIAEYRELKLEGKDGISVFTLERGGENYAVIWDNLGSSELTLDAAVVKSYTKEIETENVAYTNNGGKAILPISDKAYIKTNASEETLIEALKNAKFVRK